ncbi:MAG TPA: HIT domain-containing protein [Candidatus Saccharimonadales bacterium]|nr:HIT domain-containing protein [Candidatus Saccharimonadales bacterium]
MEDSIFTKIIKGEIPAHKIYEDEKTLAFLEIYPAQPGRTLVVPKAQIASLWDLPEQDYQALMSACQKVAQRLRDVIKPARVGVQVVGLHIPHAHVHLIPFNTMEEYLQQPDMSAEPDHAALSEMAKKLAF